VLSPGKSDNRTNTGLVLHFSDNRVNQELACIQSQSGADYVFALVVELRQIFVGDGECAQRNGGCDEKRIANQFSVAQHVSIRAH